MDVSKETDRELSDATKDHQTPLHEEEKKKFKSLFKQPSNTSSSPRHSSIKSAVSAKLDNSPLRQHCLQDSNQLTLDFGQKLLTPQKCPECGMSYMATDKLDADVHRRYHAEKIKILQYAPIKSEIVLHDDLLGGKVIHEQRPKKIAAVQQLVDEELGFAPDHSPQGCCKNYFYVQNRRILAFCTAEQITKGYRVVPGGVQSPVKRPGAPPLCCSEEAEEVRCGVSRIWVHHNHRRRGLATKLLRCVRDSNIKLSYFDSIDGMCYELKTFQQRIKDIVCPNKGSVFKQRTEEASAEQYFQFYGYLSQQQNMMQDYIRTSTYQRAMLDNTADFQDKQLVKHNQLADRIIVVSGKVEEVDIPEQVDIIISEPMGYMLFNERMLESYLHAKKWLKPGGRMFPTLGDLHVAPFTDDAVYMEQFSKANFWYQPSFHGVDLSVLRENAVTEYFKQPIVDTFDIRSCLARSQKYTVDFQTASETDLHNIDIPLTFTATQSGTVHGLAFWFDVAFCGSKQTVWLSTSPTQPLTHWYQVRCLLEKPVFLKQSQALVGKVQLRANKRQSYDVVIDLSIPGTAVKSTNTLDLKNPFFRYTGQQVQAPPGTNTGTSPSDQYWNQQDQAMLQNYSVLNGGAVMQVDNGEGVIALGGNMAPVNPGSIPSATIANGLNIAPQSLHSRTSVGGGISPQLFNTATTAAANNSSQTFALSNQLMIGDYVVPQQGGASQQVHQIQPINIGQFHGTGDG